MHPHTLTPSHPHTLTPSHPHTGADQEHKTDEMHTALMEASMDGHVDVARLLLDHGAQASIANIEHTTCSKSPLSTTIVYACVCLHESCHNYIPWVVCTQLELLWRKCNVMLMNLSFVLIGEHASRQL